jgi:hypothetical protein
MITFKEYINLNESIISGTLGTNPIEQVFISAKGLKHLLVVPRTDAYSMQADMSLTHAARGKIAKAIANLKLAGASYSWSSQVTAALRSIRFSSGDFILQSTVMGAGFERVLAEMLEDKIRDAGMYIADSIGSRLLHGADARKLPGVASALGSDKGSEWTEIISNNIDKIRLDSSLSLSISGGSYIQVDHNNKTISVVDNTARYGLRIRAIGSKTEYVIPMGEYSMTEPNFVAVVKALYKSNKSIGAYTVTDNFVPIPTVVTVKDIVNDIGRIAAAAKLFSDRHKSREIIAYHGTSTAAYNNVIARYGLQPGKGVEYGDKIKGHSEHLVYLTYSLDEARKYATRAGMGRGSVVLRVKVSDFTKIKFDEDNLQYGLRRIPDNILYEIKIRMLQLWPKTGGAVGHAHDATIPIVSKPIDLWTLRSLFDSNLTTEQRNLLDFIGGYCVTGAAHTFGYKGSISPRDIKLVEQFKSTKHDASKDDYQSKYDKVMQTYKSMH